MSMKQRCTIRYVCNISCQISYETDLYYRNYIYKHRNNTFLDIQNKRTIMRKTVTLANILEILEDSARISLETLNIKRRILCS